MQIDLSNQGLYDFPREYCFKKGVVSLILENNNLTNLPKEIVNLRNLEKLNLLNNNITFEFHQEKWIQQLQEKGCLIYIDNQSNIPYPAKLISEDSNNKSSKKTSLITEKVKVNEIAAELGITSRDVIEKALDINIELKAANSSVTMEDTDRLMKYIMSGESKVPIVKKVLKKTIKSNSLREVIYDENGFDKDWNHKVTGSRYDENGFNKDGTIHKDTNLPIDNFGKRREFYQVAELYKKVKVSKIATELGITSKDVVRNALELEIEAKTANSSITIYNADRLKKYIVWKEQKISELARLKKVSSERKIDSLSKTPHNNELKIVNTKTIPNKKGLRVTKKASDISIEDKTENWIINIWKWADEYGISSSIISRDKNRLLATKELDFLGQKFDFLAHEIFLLPNIIFISLWDVGIKYLPKDIIKLNNLYKLNLRGNPSLVISHAQEEWLTNISKKVSVLKDHINCLEDDLIQSLSENIKGKREKDELEVSKEADNLIETINTMDVKEPYKNELDLKNNGIELNKPYIDSALLSIGNCINEDDLIVLFVQEETILNVVLLKYKEPGYRVIDITECNVGYSDIVDSIKEWVYDELEDLYQLNMFKEEHNLPSDIELNSNELIITESIHNYLNELSNDLTHEIKLNEIILANNSIINIKLDFTKEQFEDETIDFRKKSLDTIKELLSDNQSIAEDIKYIIQSGITSGITSIQESMKSTFGTSVHTSDEKLLVNKSLKSIPLLKEKKGTLLQYTLESNTTPIYKSISSSEDLQKIKKSIFIKYMNMIEDYYDLIDKVEDQLEEDTISKLEIIAKVLENRQRKIESFFNKFIPDNSWDIWKIQDEFSSILEKIIEDILTTTSTLISNGLKQNNVYLDIVKIINNFYNYIGIDIYNNQINKEEYVNLDDLFKDKKLLEVITKSIGKEEITKDDLENMTTLDCKGKDIESLEGIENLKNLKAIKAGSNLKLQNIDCIRSLSLLSTIKLGDTSLKSIDALLELTNIKELSIFNYTLGKNDLERVLIILLNNNKNLKSLKINFKTYGSKMLERYLNKVE